MAAQLNPYGKKFVSMKAAEKNAAQDAGNEDTGASVRRTTSFYFHHLLVRCTHAKIVDIHRHNRVQALKLLRRGSKLCLKARKTSGLLMW